MLYIGLDFSFFPLIFPHFLGIDHLENVSMRYRYPKVLGYRVLGIDIDPALVLSTWHKTCKITGCGWTQNKTGRRKYELHQIYRSMCDGQFARIFAKSKEFPEESLVSKDFPEMR